MKRRSSRSFATLVAAGAALELLAGTIAFFGIDTIAKCYWAWFPGSGVPPGVCADPIAVVGYHLFVPSALFLALTATTLCLAIFEAVKLLIGLRRLRTILGPRVDTSDELKLALRNNRAATIDVRDHDTPYAVCIGLIDPRVVVSTGLIRVLTAGELAAVVAHEARHQRRHAPLRKFLARILTRALFYVPLLNDLLEAHLLEEELVADDEAVAVAGRTSLVLALRKISGASATAEAAAAFGELSLLPHRLEALQLGSTRTLRLNWTRVSMSLAFMGLIALLVAWMPIARVL